MTKREKLHAEWTACQEAYKAAPEGRKEIAADRLQQTTTALLEREIRDSRRAS